MQEIDKNKIIEKVNIEYSENKVMQEKPGENVLPEAEKITMPTRLPTALRQGDEDLKTE